MRKAGGVFRSGRAEAAPQTRTGKVAKTTMAEAHAIEPSECTDYPPVMPHTDYPDMMDALHPPLTVPEDVDDSSEQLMDYHDIVFQKGLAIAREIAEATMVHGRRRVERGELAQPPP